MADCKEYRHEIIEAFDGALSPVARAHADACRACGDELRGRESLRALVRGLGKVEAPADFEYRLRARMASNGNGGRRLPLRGLRLVYAFAPVAAAACFLVVASALYLRQAATTTPAEALVARVSQPERNAGAERAAATPAVGAAAESKQTGGRAVEVAPAPAVFKARRAVHRPRAASLQSRDVAEISAERGGQRSETLSLTAARVITGGGMTIPLQTPLRVVLRDERGAGRVVPMRAVSFGSQEMVARESVSRQASAAENEGVW
ncbi:MAG TPA: hypothetical protein VF588_13565 [Pyrinomonadaceae bacterium]|jgi:hypothetical protein